MREQFTRHKCRCWECQVFCLHMPGMLIPGDVDRIMCAIDVPDGEFEQWVESTFCASRGALVIADGQPVRIPTIVPQQKPDGSCVLLDGANRCMVHAVAPFGCAYLDPHLDADEADRRVQAALHCCADDYIALYRQGGYLKEREGGPDIGAYAALHKLLWEKGIRARPLEERRASLSDALDERN